MNSKYTGLQVEALLDKVQGQYTKEEIDALIGNYEKKAWMGTSAQYNALEQIEEDRMYLITDGTAPDGSNIVDLTQYYTKDEINELLTSKANIEHKHKITDLIGVIQTIESGLYFIDSNLNIGVKIDDKGIHAKNIIEYDIVKTD